MKRAFPFNYYMKRIVFAVSGASGMPFAEAVLRSLAELPDLEIHLIISQGAKLVLQEECGREGEALREYACAVYEDADMAAPCASGSWRHDGMIICPCSMNSLACIANGLAGNLIHRAADAALKERLPLILVIRETPYNLIQIRNMAAATEAGAVIMPFAPAFYIGDNSMQGAMRQFAGRLLDVLGVANDICKRWKEGH